MEPGENGGSGNSSNMYACLPVSH